MKMHEHHASHPFVGITRFAKVSEEHDCLKEASRQYSYRGEIPNAFFGVDLGAETKNTGAHKKDSCKHKAGSRGDAL
jgi:hypothetical protein